MKQPYIHFYTGDWLKDPQLSMCSPASRGVWTDFICHIHELNNGGKLEATAQQLARMARCSEAEVLAALTELADSGTAIVYKRSDIFTVTCKRMKREAELRAKRQQSGSKGGANTQAKREQTPDNDNDNEERGLEKVREFARGEGIGQGDADWFYWKGRGNGWTNGGKPMLDWKATLRSWNRAGYLPSQKQLNEARRFVKTLSFADRAKRKGEIQEQLNSQFKARGDRAWTAQESEERSRLHREMESL